MNSLFWDKVLKAGSDDCWPWCGCVSVQQLVLYYIEKNGARLWLFILRA